MFQGRRFIDAPHFSSWLVNLDELLNRAQWWCSGGSPENWRESVKYALFVEPGFTYWGVRHTEYEATLKILRERAGTVVHYRSLLTRYYSPEIPNIVLFYCVNISMVIGCGLVVSVEFNHHELLWADEKRENKVLYPLRYRMKVLWLDRSVMENPFDPSKWRGISLDEIPTLRGYVVQAPGLQHITKSECIEELKRVLRPRIEEFKARGIILPRTVVQPVTWNVDAVIQELEKVKLYIPREQVASAVGALASGKHLLLAGVPGVGKTALARIMARAHGLELVEGTANAEWTRLDLIGGPFFKAGTVVWRSGYLLKAIARCYEAGKGAILLIDELNRANLDKAFSEFFTIFGSTNPLEWEVPRDILEEVESYEERDQAAEALLRAWRNPANEGVLGGLKVPPSFRVIGTMNTYDRRYLFTLGYALLRRFAIVEITNPASGEVLSILKSYAEDSIEEGVLKQLVECAEAFKEKLGCELGVALLIDAVKLAKKYVEGAGWNSMEAIDRAFASIVIPQLEGLPLDKRKAAYELLKERTMKFSQEVFERYFPEAREHE